MSMKKKVIVVSLIVVLLVIGFFVGWNVFKEKEDKTTIKGDFKKYEQLEEVKLKDGSWWIVLSDNGVNSDYVRLISKEYYDDVDEETYNILADELYGEEKVKYKDSKLKDYVEMVGDSLGYKLKMVDGYKIRLIRLEELFEIDDNFKYNSETDSYRYTGNKDLTPFLGLTISETKCTEGKCTPFYNIDVTTCDEEDENCKEELFIGHWLFGVGGIRPVINVYKSEINNQTGNNQDNNKDEKPVAVSEREVRNLLKYVPDDVLDSEAFGNVYQNGASINELDKKLLLGKTLAYAWEEDNLITWVGDEAYIKVRDAKDLMKKMFNTEIGEISNNVEGYITTFKCGVFALNEDEILLSGGCGNNTEHYSKIDNYDVRDEELVVYEYAARYSFDDEGNGELGDYHIDKSLSFTNEEDARKYFDKYYGQYTKYKHTFKKNKTGYYWYGTEVA